MDAAHTGLPERHLRVFQGVFVRIAVVERTPVTHQHEQLRPSAPAEQPGRRVTDGRAVSVLLSGGHRADPARDEAARPLIEVLHYDEVHLVTSPARVPVDGILVSHRGERLPEEDEPFLLHINYPPAVSLHLPAGGPAEVHEHRDGHIPLPLLAPDIDAIAGRDPRLLLRHPPDRRIQVHFLALRLAGHPAEPGRPQALTRPCSFCSWAIALGVRTFRDR